MIDPAFALLMFAGVLGLLAVVFWPRRGLLARLRRLTRSSERVLLEDALKHVFTCETLGRTCSLESIAGQLEVSTGRAAALLANLVELELVRSGPQAPVLSDTGRASALQLVRTHRLWERYLADRTDVPPSEWHAEAEEMEHALTPEETERLSARLGHPRWDPHGDPIPTSGGDLPSIDGLTLAAAEPGALVEVVHLEDEPREIYEALLDDGFSLGTRMQVVERSSQAVRLRSEGRSWSVSALMARNVTVRPLAAGSDVDRPSTTLRDLSSGEAGVVSEISPACVGAQRRRLLDLGVVRGTRISAELDSAFGDPVAYRIRGALIALRGQQAEWVRIERVGQAEPDIEEGAA
jgi:DtxR family Mn-dependent transcriptional regulator